MLEECRKFNVKPQRMSRIFTQSRKGAKNERRFYLRHPTAVLSLLNFHIAPRAVVTIFIAQLPSSRRRRDPHSYASAPEFMVRTVLWVRRKKLMFSIWKSSVNMAPLASLRDRGGGPETYNPSSYLITHEDAGTPLRSVPDLPTPDRKFGALLSNPQAVPSTKALVPSFELKFRVIIIAGLICLLLI